MKICFLHSELINILFHRAKFNELPCGFAVYLSPKFVLETNTQLLVAKVRTSKTR